MIRYHLSISPIKWESQHVKGHQDKKIPYEDLDVIAQANVGVDKLVKIEHRKNITVEQNKILQGQSWRLYCKATNTWITGCVEKEMQEVCYKRVMRTISENKCKNLTISDREWENFKKLNKECPETNRRFMFKYGMNILPTKRKMARRKHLDNSTYPSCDEEENTDHLIQCKNEARRKVIGDEKEDLNTDLRKHTNKSIQEAILYLLECFQENKEPQTNNDWEKETQDAVIHQWERGQRAFFLGFWCREWEEIEEKYHKRTATRVRAQTKIRHMIRGCQKLLKNIWKQRNEEIHRNEESAENKRKHEELNKKLEEIYKNKKRIPNAYLGQDARIFRSKEDKIRRMKVKRKERWVQNAEATMSKYKRGNERKEAKLMRSFFMPSNYRHKDEG